MEIPMFSPNYEEHQEFIQATDTSSARRINAGKSLA